MTSDPSPRRSASEKSLQGRENPTRAQRIRGKHGSQDNSLAARRFLFFLFRWRGWIALPLLVSLCFPFSLQANPGGGLVTAGQATISSHGSTLTVNQLTDRAILHWQDFSIAAGETTTFVQPSATSAALNRVLGGNPSAIHGTLSSNGQIFLINPNGILVGPGGVVDTGGFLASTLDISDENFLSGGDLRFKGTSDASVVNLGKISASSSDVILIARTVENHGTIEAPNGTAALAAGSEVLVKADGEERIFIEAGNAEDNSKATQAGLIAAATAEIKAAGGNEYALAIKHTGVTRATGVSKRGGRIFLSAGGKSTVRHSGTITARKSDGNGGQVRVEAARIELAPESKIDVSADPASSVGNGGEVLIGGGYQGQDPSIRNAETVTAEEGSLILADAAQEGDGGRVIFWSDDTTRFAGTISARGGSVSGDGGFAEVSGKEELSMSGFADLSATNGTFGHLLLDPGSVVIQDGSDTAPPPANNIFNDAWIANQLGSANVTIQTSASNVGATETITVNGTVEIVWNAPTTLTLEAGRNIVMNSGALIENTHVGNNFDAIVLEAAGNDTANFVGINLQGATLRTTGSGNISLTGFGGGSGGGNHGIRLFNGATIESTNTATGTITLNGTAGSGNGNGNHGILLYAGVVKSHTGDIQLVGVGGGHSLYDPVSGGWIVNPDTSLVGRGNNMDGIRIQSGSQVISTGSASIAMDGKSGLGTGTDNGIWLRHVNTEVLSEGSGNIYLKGAGGIGPTNSGIYMHESARIAATGTGDVTVEGTTESTSGGAGVRLISSGGLAPGIESRSGTLTVTGRGETGSVSSGIVTTTGVQLVSETGNIVLEGTRGGASTGADISISSGTYIGTNTGPGPTASGDIHLIGDRITVGSTARFQSTGTLHIQPGSIGTSIGVNGGAGTLAINSTFLNTIQNGFSQVNIGRLDGTGNIAINAGTFNNPFSFRTGTGAIHINGALVNPGRSLSFLAGSLAFGSSGGIDTSLGGGTGGAVAISTKDAFDTSAFTAGRTINTSGASYGEVLINSATSIDLDNARLSVNGGTVALTQIGAGSQTVIGYAAGTPALILVTPETPGGKDIDITSALSFDGDLFLQALRDIKVSADVSATGSVVLAGDGNDNGTGGIGMVAAGSVSAGRNLTLLGHSYTNLGTIGSPSHGITIDADGSNPQLSAGGDILLQSIGTATDLRVAGRVVRTGTGAGSITLQSHRDVILTSSSAVLGVGNGGVGATDVILNADRDGVNGGNIQLTDADITTNGGDIIMGGGINPRTTAAVGSAASNGAAGVTGSGIYLSGVNLDSGTGSISLRGEGFSAGAGTHHRGVYLTNSHLQASGSGTISLWGQGGSAGLSNNRYGVHLTNATASVVDGDLTLTGNSLLAGGSLNHGVRLDGNGSGLTSTGSGTITVTGTAGGLGSQGLSYGIHIRDNAQIVSSGSGDVVLTGSGGQSGNSNFGIGLTNPPGGADPVANAAIVSSGSGHVTLTGTGGGSHGSNTNRGVHMERGVVASGDVGITITGTGAVQAPGGSGTSANHGVYLTGTNATVRSATGDIWITGRGGDGSSSGNYGIHMIAGANVTATGGADIVLDGTGGDGTSTNHGVYLTDVGTAVNAASGGIHVTGVGGNGNANSNYGIYLGSQAKIAATGTTDIVLDGTGGNGAATNYGVYLNDAGAGVEGVDGSILIQGRGGDGSGSANHGIVAIAGAHVTSTGTATVTLEGTGGAGSGSPSTGDHGILLNGATTRVSSHQGTISLTGIAAGANAWGVALQNGPSVVTTQDADISIEGVGTGGNAHVRVIGGNAHVGADPLTVAVGGDITLIADSTNWDGGLQLQSAGVLTMKPRSGGSPIQIGANGASATSMNLTVADINRIADGFSEIIIGDATAGSITTVNATTFTDNLRLMSAGNLVINGAINASGNQLALEIGGSTTQTAALTADSLRLGGDGNFTLENAANQIGTLSKDGTGSVSLTNNTALTVGSVDGISGVSGSTVDLRTSTGDLTLAAAVIATGSGDAVVLATPGNFFNNAGSTAVQTTDTSARWLIYSNAPTGNVFGDLVSNGTALWNRTIATHAPAAITETGHRYLFATAPSLTVTATLTDSKTYGDTYTFPTPVEGTHYTVSGFVDASTYAGVFLQDDATTIGLGGAPILTSTGAAATATVAGSPYTVNIAQGTLSNTAGYTFGTFSAGGALTVTPRALTVTADSQSKVYGETFPFLGTEFTTSGLVNADTVTGANLGSAGAVATAGVAGSPYAIAISGATGSGLDNYAITYQSGQFTVTPRAITVTANGGSSTYGDNPTNPGLSATNLAAFDDVSDLTGLGNSFGIDGTTNVGTYTLTVTGTLTNANYQVTATSPGTWVVGRKALTVTADNQIKTYGDLFVFAGTEFSTEGLINGDQVLRALLASDGAINTASAAGSPYLITIGGATGTGLDNYTITYVPGRMVVTPGPTSFVRTSLLETADMADPFSYHHDQSAEDDDLDSPPKGEIEFIPRDFPGTITTLSSGEVE